MGIKNLFPFLKEYCKDVNLADFAGKTAAIDASCWIHRALAISVSGGGNRERLSSIFRKHLTLVRSAGVTSFVVFDGAPLPAKANEAAKRQRMKDDALSRANEAASREEQNKLLSRGISISFEDISTCIQVCIEENIRYIVSPYESDAQIAALVKQGHADFAITEDSDLLSYGCKEIFVKAKLCGSGKHVVLAEVLNGLKLNFQQFQELCIAAGCDYLENVKGIGIHKAYAFVCGHHLLDELAKRGAPVDYDEHFANAFAVFNNQTVFSIGTMKCVPLNEWNKPVPDKLQHFCGILLDDSISIDIASGNVDPKSGVKVNNYPLIKQVPNNSDNLNGTNEDQSSKDTHKETNESERLEVDIIQIDPIPFSYKIPSFPVITINLRKVKYMCKEKEYDGLIKDEVPLSIMLGHYICTSFCSIKIEDKLFMVLWELSRDLTTTAPPASGIDDADDDEPHSLPFKVLGSAYNTSRQNALEEAYEYLYDYNRPVFVKLEAEPGNEHDKNAIGVYLMTGDFYTNVGYIPSELTKYLHPLLKRADLNISVKRIRFCTTYLMIGFYLTIEITKNGPWPNEVIQASKKVA